MRLSMMGYRLRGCEAITAQGRGLVVHYGAPAQ